jgi:RNA polymerase sigma-70 factor (ECF subfamily)
MLNILCGFNISEVAAAFVSCYAAIEKRISRAKRMLARTGVMFSVSNEREFSHRLPAVQRAIYLLFNEGYHGASAESAIRIELCHEAMRLVAILLQHPLGATPATYALSALMCFDAARLRARAGPSGTLYSLYDQDRSLWDQELISEGNRLLDQGAHGSDLSAYHIEAGIASIHAAAASVAETDWKLIVSLYDTLMTIRPSPIIALNRAIAIAQSQGPERGIQEIRKIEHQDRLNGYPFYPAALGELELRCARKDVAEQHFRTALHLARNPMESRFFETRIAACKQ